VSISNEDIATNHKPIITDNHISFIFNDAN
jgi:hypothetical protein